MTRQDSLGPEINLGLGPDPFDLGPDLLRSPQDAIRRAKVLLPYSRSYYCFTHLRTTSLTYHLAYYHLTERQASPARRTREEGEVDEVEEGEVEEEEGGEMEKEEV